MGSERLFTEVGPVPVCLAALDWLGAAVVVATRIIAGVQACFEVYLNDTAEAEVPEGAAHRTALGRGDPPAIRRRGSRRRRNDEAGAAGLMVASLRATAEVVRTRSGRLLGAEVPEHQLGHPANLLAGTVDRSVFGIGSQRSDLYLGT